MNFDVIVAHYNEDISWVSDIKLKDYNFYIYSKTDPKYTLVNNLGLEASTYLEHIVRHYKNLANHNIFIHGHKTSYHQDFDTQTILLKLKHPIFLKYFSINKRDLYIPDLRKLKAWHEWVDFYGSLCSQWPFYDIITVPDCLGFYPNAQFYVHKDLILRHSKNVYEKFLEWLHTTEIHSSASARLFEYMWHKIFTNRDIELQVDYNDILNK